LLPVSRYDTTLANLESTRRLVASSNRSITKDALRIAVAAAFAAPALVSQIGWRSTQPRSAPIGAARASRLAEGPAAEFGTQRFVA
jgi:hypothetical protein